MIYFNFGLISFFILFGFNLFKRYLRADLFYNEVAIKIEKFLEKHPEISQAYFDECVYSPFYITLNFWIKDFKDFIDNDLVLKLMNSENSEICCPWCKEKLTDKNWIEIPEVEKFGGYHCENCLMYSPISEKEKMDEYLRNL